jgi:DNA-binding HxlR family transcriptional regulator
MELDRSLSTVKALGDRSRLLILNALLAGPQCVEELSTTLDLGASTISFHLHKLVQGGLVTVRKDQYYSVYSLSPDLFTLSLRDLIAFDNPHQPQQSVRLVQDRQKVIDTFFYGGRLVKMPAQKRKRTIVLEHIARLFDAGREYGEQEVTSVIEPVFPDYCLVRRLLIDDGYMVRSAGRYRRTDEHVPAFAEHANVNTYNGEATVNDERRQRRQEYKLREKSAGIFRITNTATGKALLGSSLDLHGPLNSQEFQLTYGSHKNQALQDDFDRYGRDAFAFEIVEVVKPSDDPGFSVEAELERLEKAYAEQLDRGNTYNLRDRIRYP